MNELDAELLELTHELSALGGVTAKIGNCDVYCSISSGTPNGPGTSKKSRLFADDGCVVLRGANGTDGKRYPATQALSASENESIVLTMASAVTEDMLAGFNRSVIALGPCTGGKSELLFGSTIQASGRLPQSTLCGAVIIDLLEKAAAKFQNTTWQLCLSCFEVRLPSQGKSPAIVDLLHIASENIITDKSTSVGRLVYQQYAGHGDLCFTPSAPCQPAPLTTVNVNTPEEFNLAMALALAGSASWAVTSGVPTPKAEISFRGSESHIVMKLMLVVPARELCCCAHFVDFLGTRTRTHSRNDGKDPTALWANQELLALSRLVSEVAVRCQSSSKGGLRLDMLLEARDTAMTRIIAPLLCGNGQCSVLLCLVDEEKMISDAKGLLTLAMKAASISHPCIRSTYTTAATEHWMSEAKNVDFLSCLHTRLAEHDILRSAPRKAADLIIPSSTGLPSAFTVVRKTSTASNSTHMAQLVMDRLTSCSGQVISKERDTSSPEDSGTPPARQDVLARREKMQKRLEELTKSSELLENQRQTLLTVRRTLLAQHAQDEEGDGCLPTSLLPPTSSIHITEDEGYDTADGDVEMHGWGLSAAEHATNHVIHSHPLADVSPVPETDSPSLPASDIHVHYASTPVNHPDADSLPAGRTETRKKEIEALFASLRSSEEEEPLPQLPPPQPALHLPSPHPATPTQLQPNGQRAVETAKYGAQRRSKSLYSRRPDPVASDGRATARRLSDDIRQSGLSPNSVKQRLHELSKKEDLPTGSKNVIDMATWRQQSQQKETKRGNGIAKAPADSQKLATTSSSIEIPDGESTIIDFAITAARAMDGSLKLSTGDQESASMETASPTTVSQEDSRSQRLANQRRVMQQLQEQLHNLSRNGLYADLTSLPNNPAKPSPPLTSSEKSRRTPPSERSATSIPPTQHSPDDVEGCSRPGQIYRRLLDLKEARCSGLVEKTCTELTDEQQVELDRHRRGRKPERDTSVGRGPAKVGKPPAKSVAVLTAENEQLQQEVDRLQQMVAALQEEQRSYQERHRREVVRLQGQLDESFHPILQTYEEHMAQLQAQVDQLHRDNNALQVALQAALVSNCKEEASPEFHPRNGAGMPRRSRSQSAHVERAHQQELGLRQQHRREMKDKRITFMEKKLHESNERGRTLQAEVSELRKQVRLGSVNAKLLRESLERSEAMQKKVQGTDVQVVRLQRELQEACEQLEHARADVQRLQHREEDLKSKLEAVLHENQEILEVLRTEHFDQKVQQWLSPNHTPLLSRVRLPGKRANIGRLFTIVRNGLHSRLEAAAQQATCSQLVTQQQLQAQGSHAKQQLGKTLAALDDLSKEVEDLEHELLDAAIREKEYTQALVGLRQT